MTFISGILDKIGDGIARILARETSGYEPFTPSDPETLERVLLPGDVLLVEGNQKVSAGIKYLTQSTWSHAALYVGDALEDRDEQGRRLTLIEVNLGEGCVAAPLDKYEYYNTRICRPVGLTRSDRNRVVDFMVGSIGLKYDMRNILDLMRYLLPTPPVPTRWRRRMIAIGSGEPSRAICSTLIAQAFQTVKYPILPRVERVREKEKELGFSTFTRREILHIRHHSLFAPRDFDISPYFKIVKPTIEHGFDYKRLEWGESAEFAERAKNDNAPAEPPRIEDELDKTGKGDNVTVANDSPVDLPTPSQGEDHRPDPSASENETAGENSEGADKNDRAVAFSSALYAFPRAALDRFARRGDQPFWKTGLHGGLFGDLSHSVRLAVHRLLARRT